MTRRRRVALILLGIVALVAFLPALRDRERVDVGSLDRRDPARFLGTSQGIVHVEATGPADGPAVVLVHGVSGPMTVWDRIVPALAAGGLRVVRYDLFGRGLSDRPDVRYDEGHFLRQLADVIDASRLRLPVTIVGSSMGAIVATAYREAHPDRVARLVLVGPAGFPIQASPLSKLIRMPGVGEYLMSAAGDTMLMTHHRHYFVRPEAVPDMEAAFAAQLTVRGTKRAILSTMRSMPVQDYREGYARLGRSGTPVLVVWGRADATFPFTNAAVLQRLVPQSKLVPVDGAAHLPQVELPALVASAIREFVATTASPADPVR